MGKVTSFFKKKLSGKDYNKPTHDHTLGVELNLAARSFLVHMRAAASTVGVWCGSVCLALGCDQGLCNDN